jgi:hypothetical protein
MRKALLFIAVFSCACRAQSNLTTPVSVLPMADHSAAGVVNFYDQNKANYLQLQYNTFLAPTLATGVIMKDASGTTTGNALSLQTNGGTDYFHIIAGTDSASPGRVVANGGVEVTPVNATFSGIVVSQAQNASGIESDITGSGLAAFYGTSTNTTPTLRMTNSNAAGIGGYFSGASASILVDGEIRPNGGGNYILGDSVNYWRILYDSEIIGPSSIVSVDSSMNPTATNTFALGTSSLRWEGYFDNINVNSCTGCPSGTSYWTLVGGSLEPTANYSVLPAGTANIGAYATPWSGVFADTFLWPVSTSTAYHASYVSADSAVDVADIWGDRIWGFSGSIISGGTVKNISYGEIQPYANNTSGYTLGDSSFFWYAAYISTINSGSIDSLGYMAVGIPGVSCSGAPTSSFQSVEGIVTHC